MPRPLTNVFNVLAMPSEVVLLCFLWWLTFVMTNHFINH
jgi:hypothetical protein